MSNPVTKQPSDEELDTAIDEMLMWNINGHTEPVVFQPEMKKAIMQLIKADRARILERVDSGVLGEYQQSIDDDTDAQNRLLTEQREAFEALRSSEL